MKHIPIALLVALVTLLCVTGCTTATTVEEYDASGKIVRKTVTDRDPFDKITESTKDKMVLAWSNGWAAYVKAEVTEVTSGTVTPTGEIFAGKLNKGYLSIPKSFIVKGIDIPSIIAGTHENLSVGFTGASSASDTASANTTQTTTSAGAAPSAATEAAK